VWDIFGIAAILGKDAVGRAPCGCGSCREKLRVAIRHWQSLRSDWIVHFVVPAARFWDHIGYT
jgi:hypothetical protein